jgi:hypothetical protein
LAAFKASLHHATFVILAALRAAFVGQVDLHSRDVTAHSAQGILHYPPDLIGQRLLTFDCVVRIDLYLHADLLPNCLIENASLHLYIADAKFMELGHQPAFASGGQMGTIDKSSVPT